MPPRAVADKGTLLVAIEKDTWSEYLCGIGHATGATTPDQNLDKVPKTFFGTVYYPRTDIPAEASFGE